MRINVRPSKNAGPPFVAHNTWVTNFLTLVFSPDLFLFWLEELFQL